MASWTWTLCGSVLWCGLSAGGEARADISLVKTDAWEVYTTGRLDAFFSFGYGDGNPVPRANETIVFGGGLDVSNDSVPSSSPEAQGRFLSMRVRSGLIPNVFGLGANRRINDEARIRAFFALWATIETQLQLKETPVYADAHEAWLKLENHRWGTLTAGKALDFFSRGADENDQLYLHGYGLGFPGNINTVGPANGMIGFGVLSAFYSAGVAYATPLAAGLQLSAGCYDPTPLPGYYDATRDPRWEGELAYDAQWGPAKLRLFANGGYQNFYKLASNASVAGYGGGYGGRLEVGPIHIGVAGHYGRGLGLQYAFQATDVTVAHDLELRFFDGYSGFAQYVMGSFDLNGGAGISRVFALAVDKTAMPQISLPQQWAAAAAVVYHATNYLHIDVDYFHGLATWSLGERQRMDFLNGGLTVTW